MYEGPPPRRFTDPLRGYLYQTPRGDRVAWMGLGIMVLFCAALLAVTRPEPWENLFLPVFLMADRLADVLPPRRMVMARWLRTLGLLSILAGLVYASVQLVLLRG